jgi:hypothetical protein
MKKKRSGGEKGQTIVEYILMLLVMTTLVSSILIYVKRRYLGDPERCQTPANRNLFLCKINLLVSPAGGGGKSFQYFPFKK